MNELLDRIKTLSKELKFVDHDNQINDKFIEEQLNDKKSVWDTSVSQEELRDFTDQLFQKAEAYKLYKLDARRQLELRKQYIIKRSI